MLETIALCFFAGFMAGNGLPYFVSGSLGEGTNPSSFPDDPIVNVLFGCAAMAVGGIVWSLVDVPKHELAAWLAALAGILVVGLIHARVWQNDPWGKNKQNGR